MSGQFGFQTTDPIPPMNPATVTMVFWSADELLEAFGDLLIDPEFLPEDDIEGADPGVR